MFIETHLHLRPLVTSIRKVLRSICFMHFSYPPANCKYCPILVLNLKPVTVLNLQILELYNFCFSCVLIYIISHRSKCICQRFVLRHTFVLLLKWDASNNRRIYSILCRVIFMLLGEGISVSRSGAQSGDEYREKWKTTWSIYRLLHCMSLFVLNRFSVAPVVSLTSPRAVGKAITTLKRRSWLDI
jgi:hypothetical protein